MPTALATLIATTAVALGALVPNTAWSQMIDTSISTGRQDGSYYYIGKRLHTAMQLEHDFRIGVETSSGSVQNLARLADPENDIGLALTQSDALSRFLQDNPEFAAEFIVLGDAGKECVILITGKKNGVRSFSELKTIPGAEISVDDHGSGASVTFDYLTAMDPELAQTKSVFVDTMEALLQMKVAGTHTQLRAAMLVQRPSAPSPPVKIVFENPNDYQLVPISDSDVQNSKLPDDSVVYTFEKVKIGGSSSPSALEVDTICTRSLLLASKGKLSREIRSQLSVTMLKSSRMIIGEDD
jgi:TRAP-type uncharacterized transport system substrate-binding protein